MYSSLASTILLALALLKPSPVRSAAVDPESFPRVRPVTLDIVNRNLAPDGFLRSTVVANGTYPGPVITAVKGETLRVTVNNKLTDSTMRRSTTIGFDGIFFSSANSYNEGSAFTNTCPIAPGNSYTFDLPLGDQTGTYWYHSELDVQYVDGFRGAFIIYDPNDPQRALYDVDDLSTIIQLGDWWQNTTVSMLPAYDNTGIVPVSDSTTVNGRGRFQGGPAVPFAVTNVISGKRYRLRVISEAARNVFTISIDNHPLTVIAVDGVSSKPHTVDLITMLPGQRYDVVINANQPIANYWINAPFTGGSPTRNPHLNSTLSRSILRYKGAPFAEPTTPWTSGPSDGAALAEADLRPLINKTPTGIPDVNITLNLLNIAGKAMWTVNGISYVSPNVPTLSQILAGSSVVSDFATTENTYVLPANKLIQLTFPPGPDVHPFHLHGANFHVVQSADSLVQNVIDPIQRDVAGSGGSGTVIRFRTDNPGPWLYHCHIYFHKHAGLVTTLVSDPSQIRSNVHPSAAWNALCPTYNALPAELQ